MQDGAESKMEAALDRTLKETYSRVAGSAIPWIPTYTNGVLCSNSVDVFVTSSNESANNHPLMIKSPRKKRPPSETVCRLSLDSIKNGDDKHSIQERIELQAKLVQYRANRRAPWSGKTHSHEAVSNNDREPISRRECHRINSNDLFLREPQNLYGEIISKKSESSDFSSILIKQKEQVIGLQSADLNNPNKEEENVEKERESSHDLNLEQWYVPYRDESDDIKNIESDMKVSNDEIREEMNLDIKECRYEEHSPGHRCKSSPFIYNSKETSINHSTEGFFLDATDENKFDRKNHQSAKRAAYHVLNVKILKPTFTLGPISKISDSKKILPFEMHENKTEINKSGTRNFRIIEEMGILIIQGGATKKEILTCLLKQFPSSLSAISELLKDSDSKEMKLELAAPSDISNFPEVIISCIPIRGNIDKNNQMASDDVICRNSNLASDVFINVFNDTTCNSSEDIINQESSIKYHTAHSVVNSTSARGNSSSSKGSNKTTKNSEKTDAITLHFITLTLKGMDYVPPFNDTSEVVVSFL